MSGDLKHCGEETREREEEEARGEGGGGGNRYYNFNFFVFCFLQAVTRLHAGRSAVF